MKFLFYFIVFLVFISCGQKPKLHLADLKKASASPEEIILFKDTLNFQSSSLSQNLLPPHGSVDLERAKPLLTGNCLDWDLNTFCGHSDRLNSRLRLSVTSKGAQALAQPLGGALSDILYRLIGAPPAGVHNVIKFGPESFGLLHSYGYSGFINGKFCEPIQTNPNGKLSFGTDSKGTPLIFTSGPITNVDKPVDGWREYEVAKMCSKPN